MNEWIGPEIQVCARAGSIHCEKKTLVRFFFAAWARLASGLSVRGGLI